MTAVWWFPPISYWVPHDGGLLDLQSGAHEFPRFPWSKSLVVWTRLPIMIQGVKQLVWWALFCCQSVWSSAFLVLTQFTWSLKSPDLQVQHCPMQRQLFLLKFKLLSKICGET